MPYPYKKMTQADFDYIRSVTADNRVWVGEEIAKEYHHDEMPEYGIYPPDLYVEAETKEEISAIMAYAYQENIPVVCRGAGTGLAGGATCKYGGIMLSVKPTVMPRGSNSFCKDWKCCSARISVGAIRALCLPFLAAQ